MYSLHSTRHQRTPFYSLRLRWSQLACIFLADLGVRGHPLTFLNSPPTPPQTPSRGHDRAAAEPGQEQMGLSAAAGVMSIL